MRKQASSAPQMGMMFEKGAESFFNKGTNGRWRYVLSPEEIARCDEVAAARTHARLRTLAEDRQVGWVNAREGWKKISTGLHPRSRHLMGNGIPGRNET